MKLLDLFCGAGGAGMGYSRAGFEVTGVDHKPQPRYPFAFVQADALEYLAERGSDYDVIHTSPPCQGYSPGARMRNGYAKAHPKLIEPVREMLQAAGIPYVIENVPEAPLRRGSLLLCGSSFGLAVRRHRRFEAPGLAWSTMCHHERQDVVIAVYGDHPEDCYVRKGHPARRAASIEQAREAMGIPWMATWRELAEAIPPAYTQWIGEQLLRTAGAHPASPPEAPPA